MEVILKTLSSNDVGATLSHQAGLLVPKRIAAFFPRLDEGAFNPDMWLTVEDDDRQEWRWRYIHYNSKVVAGGTRDEYRLTHIVGFLRASGAMTGDMLELRHLSAERYCAAVRHKPEEQELLVLSTSGPWRVVALKGRSYSSTLRKVAD